MHLHLNLKTSTFLHSGASLGGGGGGGGGSSAGLAPLTVPSQANLQIMYDSLATGGLVLDGSNVVQFNDLSGNGRHLDQPSAANRPTLNSNGLVSFNGSDQYMRKDLGIPFTRPYTVVAVLNELSTSTGDVVIDSHDAASRLVFGTSASTSDDWGVYAGSWIPFQPASATFALGSYGFMAHSNGGSGYRNGVAGLTALGPVWTPDPITLGARFDLTRFANFEIGFLAYWDIELGAYNMEQLNNALAARYGY